MWTAIKGVDDEDEEAAAEEGAAEPAVAAAPAEANNVAAGRLLSRAAVRQACLDMHDLVWEEITIGSD